MSNIYLSSVSNLFSSLYQFGAGSYLIHQFSMMINSILLNFGFSEEMHNPVSHLTGLSFTCVYFFLFILLGTETLEPETDLKPLICMQNGNSAFLNNIYPEGVTCGV